MRRPVLLLVVFAACSKFLGLSDVTYETCGDGVTTGSEQCDDGNLVPFDGCSPTCTIEPMCTGGICTATCGDGLVSAPEECDDGNRMDGDGCDHHCKLEPNSGFHCELSNQPPPDKLVIPILYRDMLYNGTQSPPSPAPGHPDFESFNSGFTDLVQSALGADGKPVWQKDREPNGNQLLSGAANFCWWYHDTGCNGPTSTNPFARPVFLDADGEPTTLTLTQQGAGSNVYQFDNKMFFPLDGLGWNAVAGITPQTYAGSDRIPHNFSFTSELHYPFTYDASRPPTVEFSGDDGAWVFINGRLALDLGGIGEVNNGNVTLDATQLGLVDGGTYSLDLFQAERHTGSSIYKLTLSGFVHAVTTCTPICGDGKVVGSEACDDGPRNGMAGHCNATCSGPG